MLMSLLARAKSAVYPDQKNCAVADQLLPILFIPIADFNADSPTNFYYQDRLHAARDAW